MTVAKSMIDPLTWESVPIQTFNLLPSADYCITLFSDLTRMVTMQNLFHDGGYSSTGVSDDVMYRLGVENGEG